MADPVVKSSIGEPNGKAQESILEASHVDDQPPEKGPKEVPVAPDVVDSPRHPKRRWPFSLSPSKKAGKDEKGLPAEEEKKDDNDDNDPKAKEKDAPPPVSMFQLYRFSTRLEIIFNLIGLVLAIASGATQPLMTLLFGNLTVAFVDFGRAASLAYGPNPTPEQMAELVRAARQFQKVASKDALYLVLIGIGMFLTTYLFMVIWIRTSETTAKRIRENYLKAILRQDIAFFDEITAGEVATRIQTDTHLIYNVHINKTHLLDKRLAIIEGMGLAVFFFVIYATYGLAFSFGTTLLLRGEIDVGIIVNVFLSILIGSFSLAMLAPEVAAVASAQGAAAKLYSTIDRIPPIDSASPDGLKPDRSTVKGGLTINSVRFNYPSRPDVPVLKGVNLVVPAGKTVALVGASGSGKSTIVALIERFYDPLDGSIELDGVDLKSLNIKWLRSHIGLVSQEPTLFATTIRRNIEHGLIGTGMEFWDDEKRLEKVKEAAIKANADGFISALPEGYDTLVGERGFLLSGGQKQRVAIARAIVSDPRVLLLDEATSALDTRSEGIVQKALDKASEGRTTVVVAHRLSTIKDADVIFVMGDGMVLEQGTHAQLLQDPNGPYAKLVAAQRLRENQSGETDEESAD
ncbi:GTPase-activating protein, partial [Serendipita sp. 398]